MRLALYQPDIPQNLGGILRLAACMQVMVDVIEPCGFVLEDKRIRRAGMDYIDQARLARHASWEAFLQQRPPCKRLVLFTTKSRESCMDYRFTPEDILLFGRESAGVPDSVAHACDARVTIPIATDARSLNLAMATAIGLTEALRQTGLLPSSVPAER